MYRGKRSKKETIYTIFIGLCIYLYIYIQTSALFRVVFEPLCFDFSHVNLQLRTSANEDEVIGIFVRGGHAATLSLHMTTWARWETRAIAQSGACVDDSFSLLGAVGGSQKGHAVLRLGTVDVWHLASDTIVNSRWVHTAFPIRSSGSALNARVLLWSIHKQRCPGMCRGIFLPHRI